MILGSNIGAKDIVIYAKLNGAYTIVADLGPEKQTNIVDLAKTALNNSTSIEKDPVKISIEKDDIQLNAGMNSRKIYRLLNWKPQYEICDTIEATAEYILNSSKKIQK